MADAIIVCFVIEHPIYNGWTGWYACLCKLCMSSVPIFLEKIRKYFVFTSVVFYKVIFTFYSSRFFLQNTFSFTFPKSFLTSSATWLAITMK